MWHAGSDAVQGSMHAQSSVIPQKRLRSWHCCIAPLATDSPSCRLPCLTACLRRNGRIVCIASGELLFYALGTGEYNELARKCCESSAAGACSYPGSCIVARCRAAPAAACLIARAAPAATCLIASCLLTSCSSHLHSGQCRPPRLRCAAVAEVLRAIIGTYRELFKAPTLTEAALLSNYALTALVVDEVCREVRAWPYGRQHGGCQEACGRRHGRRHAAGCMSAGMRHGAWLAAGMVQMHWRHALLCGIIGQLARRCAGIGLACIIPSRWRAFLQGLVELTDRLSIQKAIAMRVSQTSPTEGCTAPTAWSRFVHACTGLSTLATSLPPVCAATVRAAGREEQRHACQAHERQGLPADQGAVMTSSTAAALCAAALCAITWQAVRQGNCAGSAVAQATKSSVAKKACSTDRHL